MNEVRYHQRFYHRWVLVKKRRSNNNKEGLYLVRVLCLSCLVCSEITANCMNLTMMLSGCDQKCWVEMYSPVMWKGMWGQTEQALYLFCGWGLMLGSLRGICTWLWCYSGMHVIIVVKMPASNNDSEQNAGTNWMATIQLLPVGCRWLGTHVQPCTLLHHIYSKLKS